jgi:hypothetical protein
MYRAIAITTERIRIPGEVYLLSNNYLIKKKNYYFSTLVLSTGDEHGSDVFG